MIGLIFLIMVGTGIMYLPVQSGFALTSAKGNMLYFIPSKDSCMTVGWRHSVEKTPWKENYCANPDQELYFKSTEYQSYGAGTPDSDGQVEFLTDGYIRVKGIERTIPYYSLFYIPISQYYVQVDGEKHYLKDFVPEFENVQIYYKSLRIYQWISLKF